MYISMKKISFYCSTSNPSPISLYLTNLNYGLTSCSI